MGLPISGLRKKPEDDVYQADQRIQANLRHLRSQMQPHVPAEWERLKAIRDERDVLRTRCNELELKVRELEAQLDQCIDAMTKPELVSTPSAIKHEIDRAALGRMARGRPKGRKDSKPRKRKGNA